MLIACGILYVIFGDSTLQTWDRPTTADAVGEEMKALHDVNSEMEEKEEKNSSNEKVKLDNQSSFKN
jgi:hypothetical protein